MLVNTTRSCLTLQERFLTNRTQVNVTTTFMVGIALWGKLETGCKAAVHMHTVQDLGVVHIIKDGCWKLILVHMKERFLELYALQEHLTITIASVITRK